MLSLGSYLDFGFTACKTAFTSTAATHDVGVFVALHEGELRMVRARPVNGGRVYRMWKKSRDVGMKHCHVGGMRLRVLVCSSNLQGALVYESGKKGVGDFDAASCG